MARTMHDMSFPAVLGLNIAVPFVTGAMAAFVLEATMEDY
jgi:hypothetical protein